MASTCPRITAACVTSNCNAVNLTSSSVSFQLYCAQSAWLLTLSNEFQSVHPEAVGAMLGLRWDPMGNESSPESCQMAGTMSERHHSLADGWRGGCAETAGDHADIAAAWRHVGACNSPCTKVVKLISHSSQVFQPCWCPASVKANQCLGMHLNWIGCSSDAACHPLHPDKCLPYASVSEPTITLRHQEGLFICSL